MKKSLFTNVSHFFLFLSFALSVTSPGMVNASDVTFSFEVVDKEERRETGTDKNRLSKTYSQGKNITINQKEPPHNPWVDRSQKTPKLEKPENSKQVLDHLNTELALETTKFEKLLLLIDATPELSSALADIRISEGNIARLKANSKPVVSLSTSGNVPIASSLEPGDRGYRTDKRFIDITANLKQTVFDFGKNAHLVNSEEKTKKAKEIAYKIERRMLLLSLLNLALIFQKASKF